METLCRGTFPSRDVSPYDDEEPDAARGAKTRETRPCFFLALAVVMSAAWLRWLDGRRRHPVAPDTSNNTREEEVAAAEDIVGCCSKRRVTRNSAEEWTSSGSAVGDRQVQSQDMWRGGRCLILTDRLLCTACV
jgi:hypothetical protein